MHSYAFIVTISHEANELIDIRTFHQLYLIDCHLDLTKPINKRLIKVNY